ncbi:MAG TPA: response regulator [Longimicrobiales bacterium]|nr:response regulator [Longimicrobiales bacterium]
MTDRPGEAPRTIKVLLVEDALDQALLVRAMLGDELYEVTHAQDGQRGVELFHSREFDLVITDLNLPGMDGFDLTRELKRQRPDVPVLATTGYTSPGYADSAYRAGVDALLRKPLEQPELLKTVRELLPEIHPAPESPPNVLAIGARPGDVVLGCGGTLAFHRAQGHDVLIFILACGEPGSGLDAEAAREAAERLGARVILADPEGTNQDLTERQILLSRVVRELAPDVAYIPSMSDHDPYRKEAHRLGRTVLASTRAVLAYATPTVSFDFRPGFFKPVEKYMSHKLDALEAFYGGSKPPRELSARFAQASARYWGRMANFGEVEPFEVIKGEGRR